jgi:hypothetical protein
MVGISSLVKDVDQGKPLPWSMEPRARLSTYACWIGRGETFPKYLEHNTRSNPFPSLNVQLRDSVDDVSIDVVPIHWPRPWYLPEP